MLMAARIAGRKALIAYRLIGAGVAAFNGHMFAVPFILLYAGGFGYVGLQGVWDERMAVRYRRRTGSGRSAKRSTFKRPGVKRYHI